MNDSIEHSERLPRAEMVHVDDKYYPTAVLDETGKVISKTRHEAGLNFRGQDINPVEVTEHDEGRTRIYREPGHGVKLDQCQDYSLAMSTDKGRWAVLADGVSNSLAGQAVANLLCHYGIMALNERNGSTYDSKFLSDFFAGADEHVKRKFNLGEIERDLEKACARHFSSNMARRNAEKGYFGGSTFAFMHESGGWLNFGFLGTGGAIVFKDGFAKFEYGDKSNERGQINIGIPFNDDGIKRFSVRAEKGDVAILFTDGMLRNLEFSGCRSFVKGIEQSRDDMPPGTPFEDVIVDAFRFVPANDDKTMVIFKI